MGMGLDVPNHFQIIRSDVLNNPVCSAVGGAPGSSLEVEHRVDDRRFVRLGVVDHVRYGVRRFIKEPRNCGAHAFVGLGRSEEHTSEIQSLMPLSYTVFILNTKIITITYTR